MTSAKKKDMVSRLNDALTKSSEYNYQQAQIIAAFKKESVALRSDLAFQIRLRRENWDMLQKLSEKHILAQKVCEAAIWQCYDHPQDTEQGLIDAIKAWEDAQ